MSEEGGEFQSHVEGCFLNIVAMERIVFTTVLKAGWQPCEAWLAMTSIVTMEDPGAQTRYVARALHIGRGDMQKDADMRFMDGWGRVIDQMGEMAGRL